MLFLKENSGFKNVDSIDRTGLHPVRVYSAYRGHHHDYRGDVIFIIAYFAEKPVVGQTSAHHMTNGGDVDFETAMAYILEYAVAVEVVGGNDYDWMNVPSGQCYVKSHRKYGRVKTMGVSTYPVVVFEDGSVYSTEIGPWS